MLQQSKKVYAKVKKTFGSSTDCLIKLVLQQKYLIWFSYTFCLQ